ncbi:MAG: sugar-binding domain-containing protein [Chloroflexota bacterium]
MISQYSTSVNTPSAHPLHGDWQVQPIALNAKFDPTQLFSDALSVPQCAHLQPILYPNQPYWGDHLRKINKQAWLYRRTFTLPDVPYQRVRLRFEGVDHFADVWLNGHYLGHHEGHFAPFEFDVTDFLNSENVLLVRVTSPWDAPNPSGSYPTDHVIRGLVKGLYEHGEGVIPPNVNPLGIWRPVSLLLDQGLSLDHIRIRTDIDGKIALSITATNATMETWNGTLNLNIVADNHDGKGVQAAVELEMPPGMQRIEHTLQVTESRLWWPWDQGLPNLYRLTADLCGNIDNMIATKTEIFGIRTVKLERTPERFTYYVNGRNVFLRGSAYIPALYLSECNSDTLARDLTLAREANLNLLRVHTHVSPLELYDLCNRAGVMIWQDFELNWVHESSPEFEIRARKLQREMIDLLDNHPSIITWACHNEPTMLFIRRQNLETHPDPALYADAMQQDPTRPVFICSGQMESDWQRAGDVHTYYGAIWSTRYTDIYSHRYRLQTEFGFEAPAALSTLKEYPASWERLKHLEPQIDDLWAYQAELIQFHVEHLRRLRADCCGGYIHFWLADLVPQVGCGVLDSKRLPKGGYETLQRSSQPLQVALEHDGRHPHSLWVFNDTPQAYPNSVVCWKVSNQAGIVLLEGQITFDVKANTSQQVMPITWNIPPDDYGYLELSLCAADSTILASNFYRHPFQPLPRPQSYPWNFDPVLGVKVFDQPGAASLANQTNNPIIKRVPLRLREKLAEWALRQPFPPRLLSFIARIATFLEG